MICLDPSSFFFFLLLLLLLLQKLFYRGKSASELHTRYLDTYLSQYGSVLPPHYLVQREDGTVEKVPIPLTDPDNCDPALLGMKVGVGFLLFYTWYKRREGRGDGGCLLYTSDAADE